jgi:c-di-GMP-binding flagellar brake protein YcgR
VDALFANTIKNRLFQGNKIVVRFLYEGTIFGFQSELIKAIFDPIKLLFISYPKIIARHELRSQKRFESFLPSDLSIKNKMFRGVILDISERGCRCLIKASQGENMPNITINQDLTINFQLPGVENEMTISGIVKNFKRDINELHLGIQFDKISQPVQNKINQYVLSVQPS